MPPELEEVPSVVLLLVLAVVLPSVVTPGSGLVVPQPVRARLTTTAEAARLRPPRAGSSAPQWGQTVASDLMCSRQAGQA